VIRRTRQHLAAFNLFTLDTTQQQARVVARPTLIDILAEDLPCEALRRAATVRFRGLALPSFPREIGRTR
jgi:hypothetical protein